MATSFVIFAPEKERKHLRECGVLPSDFFGDIDHVGEDGAPFYFWPYELDYAAGEELAKDVCEHPVHLPSFFGVKESSDVDERNLATDRVVKTLRSVAIHVAFLDDEDADGRQYTTFHSFSELNRWSRNLDSVLKVAFAQNEKLKAPENVLVLIARSSAVKASEKDLVEFKQQIGKGRTFTSCYFVDHHLAIGKGCDFIPSRDVWDLMVARLLHAFYLSADGRSGVVDDKFWMKPGMKVWRASECVFAVDETRVRNFREIVRSWVYKTLCEKRSLEGEAGNVLGAMPVASSSLAGDVDIAEKKSISASDYWQDVDVGAYLQQIQNQKTSNHAVESLVSKIAERRISVNGVEKSDGRADVFKNVHEDAGYVLTAKGRLSEELQLRKDELVKLDPESEWSSILQASKQRLAMLDGMHNGEEYEALKKHYIGWKLGFAVVVIVSSAYGGLSYLILSKVLDAGVFYSLLAGSAITFGSLVMLIMILFCHARAAKEVVSGVSDYCARIDQIDRERDSTIVRSAYDGMRRHAIFNQLSWGSRAKSLLGRLDSMLSNELQGSDAVCENNETHTTLPTKQLRERFLSVSHFEVSHSSDKGAFERKDVEQMASALFEAKYDRVFSEMWKGLCLNDFANAGHFPAGRFVPALRKFSKDMLDDIFSEIVNSSADLDSESASQMFMGWLKGLANTCYYSGFSAEINADVVDPISRCQLVFSLPRLKSRVSEIVNPADKSFSSRFVKNLLADAGTMAFAYEEAVVDMEIDSDTTLVKLVEKKTGHA